MGKGKARVVIEGGGTLFLVNRNLEIRCGRVRYGDGMQKGETWAAGAPEPRAIVYRVCWENGAGGNCMEYDSFDAAWDAFTVRGDPVLHIPDLETGGA